MIRRYIEYYRFDGTDYQPCCGSDSIQNFDNRCKTENIVYNMILGFGTPDIKTEVSHLVSHAKFMSEHGKATHFAIIKGTILENKRITKYHQIL